MLSDLPYTLQWIEFLIHVGFQVNPCEEKGCLGVGALKPLMKKIATNFSDIYVATYFKNLNG